MSEALITGRSQLGSHRMPPPPPLRFGSERALVPAGDIKRGDDVLVHVTASGVGFATIQLTRFYGA